MLVSASASRKAKPTRLRPSVLDRLLCLGTRNRVLPGLNGQRGCAVLASTSVAKSIHPLLERVAFPAE